MKKFICLSLLVAMLSFCLTAANSNAEKLNIQQKDSIENKSDKLKDFIGPYKNIGSNNYIKNNEQINLAGLPEAAGTKFPLVIIQGPDMDSKIFIGPPVVKDDKIIKWPGEGNNSSNDSRNNSEDSSSSGLIEIKNVSNNK